MATIQCHDCGQFCECAHAILVERVTARGSDGVEVKSRVNVCGECNVRHNTKARLHRLIVLPTMTVVGLTGLACGNVQAVLFATFIAGLLATGVVHLILQRRKVAT